MTRNKGWQETVAPHCEKLKLSGTFGSTVTLTPKGCLAYADLLADMANKLDGAKDTLEDIVTLEGNNV